MLFKTINTDYENKYLSILKDIILKLSDKLNCDILLFGSRSGPGFRKGADFDIGIHGLNEQEFSILKNKTLNEVEESIIPYSVDIVNFSDVTNEFKSIAMRNAVYWKKNCP